MDFYLTYHKIPTIKAMRIKGNLLQVIKKEFNLFWLRKFLLNYAKWFKKLKSVNTDIFIIVGSATLVGLGKPKGKRGQINLREIPKVGRRK